AGINYAWFVSEKAYVNLGLSMNHINRPSESFYGKTSSIDSKIPIRYTTFLNGNFKIGDIWILNPNIYYSKMSDASETVIGMNANRNLSGDGKQQLILGLYYRSNDAFIPMVGFQSNNLRITANYDVTASSLGAFNSRQGGYEISIIKSGIYGGGDKSVKCPTVKF
ncbi:MAG: type IX secretion system membrane protein PorP/SprF, partial [Chitinophagaceae bacterium]